VQGPIGMPRRGQPKERNNKGADVKTNAVYGCNTSCFSHVSSFFLHHFVHTLASSVSFLCPPLLVLYTPLLHRLACTGCAVLLWFILRTATRPHVGVFSCHQHRPTMNLRKSMVGRQQSTVGTQLNWRVRQSDLSNL